MYQQYTPYTACAVALQCHSHTHTDGGELLFYRQIYLYIISYTNWILNINQIRIRYRAPVK